MTGARKGIGRGIAYALAKEGADVGVNDYIDDEETQKTINLVESLGKKSSKHIGDVSKKKNIDSMIDEFLEVHRYHYEHSHETNVLQHNCKARLS